MVPRPPVKPHIRNCVHISNSSLHLGLSKMFRNLKKTVHNVHTIDQGGKGHCTVNYTLTQSFEFYVIPCPNFIKPWLVGLNKQCSNNRAKIQNYRSGKFFLSSLGIYKNLQSNVISLKAHDFRLTIKLVIYWEFLQK